MPAIAQSRMVVKAARTQTRRAAPRKPAKKAPARKTAKKPARKTTGDDGGLDVGNFFRTGKYYEKESRGTKAVGAQRSVGYRGSGEKGSAPQVDAQGVKAKHGGTVYRLGSKYGGNVDEYSPIWTPETYASTGDTYKPGALGLTAWFLGFSALLAVGGYAIYSTSALS